MGRGSRLVEMTTSNYKRENPRLNALLNAKTNDIDQGYRFVDSCVGHVALL